MKIFSKIIFLALIFLLITPQTSHAGTFRFGTKQEIRRLQDVTLLGPQDEDLFLGHLVETHFFILGTHVKDSGYVLGINGNRDGFYSMPEGGNLEVLQTANTLPKTLPPYKLSTFDYVIGYSLWLFLFAITAWIGLKKIVVRNKPKEE